MKIDALEIDEMASGHLCLNLSEKIGWEGFDNFATEFLETVGGNVLRRDDSVIMRLWEVIIHGCKLHLVYDDNPVSVTLESSDETGDSIIENLFEDLDRQNRASPS